MSRVPRQEFGLLPTRAGGRESWRSKSLGGSEFKKVEDLRARSVGFPVDEEDNVAVQAVP